MRIFILFINFQNCRHFASRNPFSFSLKGRPHLAILLWAFIQDPVQYIVHKYPKVPSYQYQIVLLSSICYPYLFSDIFNQVWCLRVACEGLENLVETNIFSWVLNSFLLDGPCSLLFVWLFGMFTQCPFRVNYEASFILIIKRVLYQLLF